eukprot:Skav206384  [mRNA]  locus=scaffold834:482889:484274:- [translate_table: standard]
MSLGGSPLRAAPLAPLAQVEIEYFLALMAQLPVGSDLPATAAAQLREIPAKLTLENAKDGAEHVVRRATGGWG